VNSRFRRTIGLVLIAAQLLLPGPMSFASGAPQGEHAGAMHCEDPESASGHSSECPCCPDEASTSAGCLTACLAIAAPTSSVAMLIAPLAPDRSTPASVPARYLAGDPPLKPPPIR